MRCHLPVAMAVSLLPCSITEAEIRMPAVFGDHMVLQQGAPVPVWGWAEAGATVEVSIAGQSHAATADEQGRWRVDLRPLDVGEPLELSVTSGDDTATMRDVLVGEVWLCAGQSNMDWPVRVMNDAEAEIAAADHPRIRLFRVGYRVADAPAEDVEGQWRLCNPETVVGFSGVAYFFGRDLGEKLDVPIGLMLSSYGGSPAEGWTSRRTLASDDDFQPILSRAEKNRAGYVEAMRLWRAEFDAAEAAGDEPPPAPDLPFGPHDRRTPGGLFNAMIHPLIPFGIRGAVWYQGESNTWRAEQYRELLTSMVGDWRARWGRGDFPFGIVQLPNYVDPRFPPCGWSWPELREAQRLAAHQLDNAGLIITIDVGSPINIHPRDKQTVGARLARWALATVYGHDVAATGPIYRDMLIQEDGKITIGFDHAGSGLRTRDGGPPAGFVIAGEGQKFRWASAEIVGDRVLVWSDRIPRPVVVRYGWHDNPAWANLVNDEGLPASPFRTDNRSAVTAGRR